MNDPTQETLPLIPTHVGVCIKYVVSSRTTSDILATSQRNVASLQRTPL